MPNNCHEKRFQLTKINSLSHVKTQPKLWDELESSITKVRNSLHKIMYPDSLDLHQKVGDRRKMESKSMKNSVKAQ